MPTVVCPACGAEAPVSEERLREVGSWVFFNCPTCHRQSDVTFLIGPADVGSQ